MTRQEILAQAIDQYGRQAQIDMCIEECAELTKALIKNRRFGGDRVSEIIDEIADVQIMLDQMRMIFGDTEIIEKYKVDRLKGRLDL